MDRITRGREGDKNKVEAEGLRGRSLCPARQVLGGTTKGVCLDDRYAINLGKTEIRDGYRTGDVERILNQYADGFGDFSHGFPSFGGAESKAVLRERLMALFARYRVTLAPVAIDVLLFGATALNFGWHELTFTPHTGEPAFLQRSRYLELWSKQADNLWRIVLFQDNEDQPPRLMEEMTSALRTGELDAATRSWTLG